jgi:alpha-L-fucosidase
MNATAGANETCCYTAAASDGAKVCNRSENCCAGQSFGSSAQCCPSNSTCEFHVGAKPTCGNSDDEAQRRTEQQQLPAPTKQQLRYLDNELSMFLHYSICTYNDGCMHATYQQQNCLGPRDSEHPYPATSFNPTQLDTEQWAATALGMGAKQVCLTVHHSGGFALWPTAASNYSVAASPFNATGRDILSEFVGSMHRHGIEPCFYIVLNMDCAESHYTVPGYLASQKLMLTELLTNYGPIQRLWWDMYGIPEHGFNPGGFPAEFAELAAHAKSLQPETVLLPGPDGCLVGGEGGGGWYPVFNFNQGETFYECQEMATPPVPGNTTIFAPHEQDHSIQNPGDMWWWVPGHPWLSGAELFEHYLVSIGRGSTYILNVPPNTTGLIPDYMVNATGQLGRAVRASFSPQAAVARLVNQTVQCSNSSSSAGAVAQGLVLRAAGGSTFGFDAVVLEEDIRRGNQRIASYELSTCSAPLGRCDDESQWQLVAGGGAGAGMMPQTVPLGLTVGRKVIERGFNGSDGLTLHATALRFRCTAAFPAGVTSAYLRSFSAHKMAPPTGWPTFVGCGAFGCTCRGMADYYGVYAGKFGCAPGGARTWWIDDARCVAADYTTHHPPFPGCKAHPGWVEE